MTVQGRKVFLDMAARNLTIALALVFSSGLQAAYNSIYDRSPDTEAILNHKNRKLPPPPRNIKSDRFNPEERFEVALQRSETAVSITDTHDSSSNSAYEVLLGTNRKIRDKSVSLGVVGGGVAGLVGLRAEVSVPYVWLSGSIGSGVDYTTWGLGVRKYIFPKLAVLPFIDLRYSEWLLKQSDDPNAEYPFPSYATEKLFENAYEKQVSRLLSPGLGMAYLGRDGFGVEVGAQYLWSLNVAQGALLGSLGLVKYF